MDEARTSQVHRFLELLFEEALEDSKLKFLITSIEPLTDEEKKKRKAAIRTRTFTKIDAAAIDYILKTCDEAKMDVYACMGLVREVPPRGHRSVEEDVFSIGTFWQDFDTFVKGRSKKKYPPTIEDAGKLLNIGPHKPSFSVLSGYGIHGYWKPPEPWRFDTAEGRAAAKSASHRIYLTFSDRAALEGWQLDSTFDLVRIMRIPGTLNYKDREAPRPVELVEPVQDRRYDFDGDLEQYLVDEKFSASVTKSKHRWEVSVGYVDVNPKKGLSGEVEALLVNNEEFNDSWHSRAKLKDTSPSGFDMSCVNFMVQAGFSDQQIADAIAYRRQHVEKEGDRSKGMRLGYIQGTIGKVRMDTKPDDIIDRLDAPAPPPIDHEGNVQAGELNAADRNKHLESLRSLLKLHANRYVQVGRDQPHHYIETNHGRLDFGTTDDLFRYEKVSQSLWNQHDISLSEELRKPWARIVKQVMGPLKEVDDSTEPTKVDKMLSLIQQYVEDSRPEPEENMPRAISASRPFYLHSVDRGGLEVWIRRVDFERILNLQRNSKFFRSSDEAILLFKQASEFTATNGGLWNQGKRFVGDNGKSKRYFPFSQEKIDQGSAADPDARGNGVKP